MEGYLDAYNPIASGTPAGIFVNRVEVEDFSLTWCFTLL